MILIIIFIYINLLVNFLILCRKHRNVQRTESPCISVLKKHLNLVLSYSKLIVYHHRHYHLSPVSSLRSISVSVEFWSKERGTRVHFSGGQDRKSRSSVFFCSETKRKRLLRRLTRFHRDQLISVG